MVCELQTWPSGKKAYCLTVKQLNFNLSHKKKTCKLFLLEIKVL